MRQRGMRRRAEHLQRHAGEDPLAPPLLARKGACDRHLLVAQWAAGAFTGVQQHHDIRPRCFDAIHFCDGTAGMNCVSPFASAVVANATPLPMSGAMRSVVAAPIATPSFFSGSVISARSSSGTATSNDFPPAALTRNSAGAMP